MITEFFGLPGSGKTHVMRERFGVSDRDFKSIQDRLYKYVLVLWFVVLHPRTFTSFLTKTIKETRHNRPLLLHKMKFLFFNACARARVGSKDKMVVGEGLIQYLLSLFEQKISSADLVPFAQFVRLRRIIIVEAPREVREKRMVERKRVPRSKFGAEYVASRREIEEQNYEVIKRFFLEHTGVEIVQNP